MEPTVSERDVDIVAAIQRGVPLRTVCAIFEIDALTVRRTVEAAGQPMPVDRPGPDALIAPRESEMLRRALDGEDFSVIARGHGVSREWVRLVVKRHTGLSAKDLKGARVAARQQFRLQRAMDLAKGDADLPLDELAAESGVTVREVEVLLGPAEAARRRRGRNVSTAAHRDQLLDDMRRIAALPGGMPLSGPFYDRHRGAGVSSGRLVQVFGTWAEACEAAGVAAPKAVRANYTQAWSREDCLRWVLQYLGSTDRPTHAGYDAWARAEDGAPSSGTVRLRCGTWIAAVRDAYSLDAGLTPVADGREPEAIATSSRTMTEEAPDDGNGQPADALPEPPQNIGQGRQHEVEVRLKVEMAAHERLMAYYRDRGWQVIDTHLGSPYDASATKGGEVRFLEAKGTQSVGATVLVTRGEVEHAQAHPGQCFMGVWSGIEIDESGTVQADSGDFRVFPFEPDAGELEVVGYQWRTPAI